MDQCLRGELSSGSSKKGDRKTEDEKSEPKFGFLQRAVNLLVWWVKSL